MESVKMSELEIIEQLIKSTNCPFQLNLLAILKIRELSRIMKEDVIENDLEQDFLNNMPPVP